MSKSEKLWEDVIKPYKAKIDSEIGNTKTVSVMPLKKGFGNTIGNALRRVLLSSIRGSAISAVRFDGVEHSFTTINGVSEDVEQIIANLKKVIIRSNSDMSYHIQVKKVGPGKVLASDLSDQGVDIVNPDQVICHLSSDVSFGMECVVTSGLGYITEDQLKAEDNRAGMIYMDAVYNPIIKVGYEIEDIRAGSSSEYEKLVMTIETNGAVDIQESVSKAAKILIDQFKSFVDFELKEEEKAAETEEELTFDSKLLIHVSKLNLTGRAKTCVESQNIAYLGDLVVKTESDLLKVDNVGKTSVNEIKQALSKFGLTLGMIVTGWPPSNLDMIAARYSESQDDN